MSEKNDSVKEALLDLQKMKTFLKETSEDTVNTIFENAVKKGLKNYMTEAFEEEDPDKDAETDDVNGDNIDIEGVEDTDSTESGLDNVEVEEPETDNADVDVDVDVDGADVDSDLESGEEEDFDIDQFKSDDGEYDLTGADTSQLIKVFKRIDGNDSVSITDLGDGKIELVDNETNAEYMIDTTPSAGADVDPSIDADLDPEIEIDLDDEPVVSEGMHHSYEGNETELSEENEPEVGPDAAGEGLVDEKNITQSYSVNRRAGVLSQTRAANAPGANKRNGGQLVGESKEVKALKIAYTKKINSLTEQHESFKKSTENEMVQLKSALGQFVGQLKENAVLNNSLGKFVKLILENSTTKDEKAVILNRFASEAKSIEAGNLLFETIQRELNGKVISNSSIDKQFSAEGSKVINEKVIYQNADMVKMQELMRKMDKY